MSDDLDMQAIQEFTDFNTSAIAAIQAGNDLILCSNYTIQIPAVLDAIKNVQISEDTIDISYSHLEKEFTFTALTKYPIEDS